MKEYGSIISCLNQHIEKETDYNNILTDIHENNGLPSKNYQNLQSKNKIPFQFQVDGLDSIFSLPHDFTFIQFEFSVYEYFKYFNESKAFRNDSLNKKEIETSESNNNEINDNKIQNDFTNEKYGIGMRENNRSQIVWIRNENDIHVLLQYYNNQVFKFERIETPFIKNLYEQGELNQMDDNTITFKFAPYGLSSICIFVTLIIPENRNDGLAYLSKKFPKLNIQLLSFISTDDEEYQIQNESEWNLFVNEAFSSLTSHKLVTLVVDS
ncbi:hypothetical protein TRFO_38575 [Tritrichomonas foetus]|uniref:Uncharacterized protein n=1 Tax=Tritrichomonas foetus TaxID=1144522 RepID=A0A1J4JCE9_9EUKA|nr:hypothetical protein TRFO_38575 [Tritrichomonas foetus]|eukprot:OHS95323.1 hypothetical protein TRFO_38575 [Tritrichomonas foetus]